MRSLTAIAFSVLVFSPLVAYSQAIVPSGNQSIQPLDGWGQYKFGMAPSQVSAIPGLQWRQSPVGPASSLVAGEVNQFGIQFIPFATFNDQGQLQRIELDALGISLTREQCRGYFESVVLSLEKQYGLLTPSYEGVTNGPQPKPIAETIRNVPGGGSSYRDYTENAIRPSPLLGNIFNFAEAQHKIGERSVSIRMNATDKTCGIRVSYSSGPIAPPPQPKIIQDDRIDRG